MVFAPLKEAGVERGAARIVEATPRQAKLGRGHGGPGRPRQSGLFEQNRLLAGQQVDSGIAPALHRARGVADVSAVIITSRSCGA